jgi:hypothetical protein
MIREDKILPEKEQSGTGKKLLSSAMAYRDVMWQIAAMRGMESLLQVASGTDSRSSYGKTLEEKGDDELAKLVQLLGLLQGFKVPSLVRGVSKDIGYKGENITIDKEEAGNLWVALQFARGMGLMDIGLGRSYGYTDYVAPAVSIVDGKPLYSFQGGGKHAPLRHFEGILKRPDTDRDPYALTANSAERRYRIYEWIDKNGVQEALYKQSGQLYGQYRIPDIKGTRKLPLKPLAEIKTIVAGTGFNKLTEAIILDSFQITVGEETITGSQKELAVKVLEGALDTKDNKYSKIFAGDIEGAEKFAMQEAAKDIYSGVNKEVLSAFDAWVGENLGTQNVSPNKLSKGLKHLPTSK